MKFKFILFLFLFCGASRADIFCQGAGQSASVELTDTEVVIRLAKWASPESIAAKMHKGPGKAKAFFAMAFTRKTGPSVAQAREACVFGADNPLLVACEFREARPVQVKLTLEGSDAKETFEIVRAQFSSTIESNRFVDAQGTQQEQKISFSGVMFGPAMPSGSAVAIEFEGKDCGLTPPK